MKNKGIYEKYIKRLFDIVLALLAIILLSPVFLVVYIISKIKIGSPVMYTQDRVGLNNKIFTIYKYRSMTDERNPKTGELLDDKDRIPAYGNFLRKTSIDELPQLFNILKGDMSFIGPRPQLVEFMDYYSDFQLRRHEVRPGLSGLAQINGRNNTTWARRFEYDVEYVDKISFMTDMKIFFTTIKKVILREDIYNEEGTTMEKFNGKN